MKYYGKVGFAEQKEVPENSGIWEEVIVEKSYMGDVKKISRRNQTTEHLNNDITFSNQFSIFADSYAFEHYGFIRYIEWMNSKWSVTNVTVSYPRLILEIGGVYND